MNPGSAELLTLALVLAMAAAPVLAVLQSPYCSKCAHCREEARLRAEREHNDYHRIYGEEACRRCNPK